MMVRFCLTFLAACRASRRANDTAISEGGGEPTASKRFFKVLFIKRSSVLVRRLLCSFLVVVSPFLEASLCFLRMGFCPFLGSLDDLLSVLKVIPSEVFLRFLFVGKCHALK